MRTTRLSTLAAFLILSAAPSFGAAPLLVKDWFDDDTLGQAPGPPEIGSSSYFGVGTHTVINNYGSQSLRSVDNSATDGFAIQWVPTAAPTAVEANFLLVIESSAGVSTILNQSFAVTTSGGLSLVNLKWIQGGIVEVQSSAGGTSPTFTWASGTAYTVRFRADCVADTVSLWIDGAPLVAGHSLGVDCSTVGYFADSSPIVETVSRSIDEVSLLELSPIFADSFESGDTSAWSSTMPPISPGDTCSQARPYTSGTLTGDLSDNTASGVSDSCGIGNTIDEWVAYTAPCTGTVTVSTCHPGTAIDTIVSAWSGATCAAATEAACNDDANGAPSECDLAGSNRKSQAVFAVTSGDSLYFRVSTFNDAAPGAFEISAWCSP